MEHRDLQLNFILFYVSLSSLQTIIDWPIYIFMCICNIGLRQRSLELRSRAAAQLVYMYTL